MDSIVSTSPHSILFGSDNAIEKDRKNEDENTINMKYKIQGMRSNCLTNFCKHFNAIGAYMI